MCATVAAGRPAWRGWLFRNAGELSALWGFAVLQPTLDVLSDNADLFVARQVQGWSFVFVMAAFALLPPLVLVGAEALVGLAGEGPRTWLHRLFLWGLLALVVLYVLERLFGSRALVLVPLAGIVSVVLVVLHARVPAVRSYLVFLAPAPLVFLGYFLLFSPSHKLIFPDEAGASPELRSQAPVVVLVLDELPVGSLMDGRGRIDAALFPNFAELARRGTWYRNTTTAADFTEEAVPAILDGRRPRHGTLPILPDHPRNLFTLLGSSHRIEASEYITWLCPPSLCPNRTRTVRRMTDLTSALAVVYGHVILPARYARRLPEIGSTWQESRAARDPRRRVDPGAPQAALARHGDAQFERFLRSMGPPDSGRPPFHFLHSSLPHVPWKHLPSGRLYTGNFQNVPGLFSGGNRWGPNADLVEGGLQRHLLQVEYADLLVGRMLRRLRETGLFERSLVVVTADHGVSFAPGGERRPVNRSNAGEVGLVPFFVKAPGQSSGEIVDTRLQTTDVLPTIAAGLGVRIPWRVDGRAASELPASGRRRLRILRHGGGGGTFRPALLERQRLRSVRRRLALSGSGQGRAGLYGLGPDHDLIGSPVAELSLAEGLGGRVVVEGAGDLLAVDPRSRFLPAWFRGSVPNGVERVLIALNGRVRGAAPTYREAGTTRFSTLVDERGFRAGRNRVELFAASGTGGDRRIVRLR